MSDADRAHLIARGIGITNSSSGPPPKRPSSRRPSCVREASGCAPSSRAQRPRVVAVAGITAYRRRSGFPRRRSAGSRNHSSRPSCGSSPTRAGSTLTRRSPRWPPPTAHRPRLPAWSTPDGMMCRCPNRCASPTRSSSAGTRFRAGLRSPRWKSRGAWRTRADIELIGVAGRHRRRPDPAFTPPIAVRQLPIARPWLYESWNRFGWPGVERATGAVDVCHSTIAIPAATKAAAGRHRPRCRLRPRPRAVHAPRARVMGAGLERCRAADMSCARVGRRSPSSWMLGFDADRIRARPVGCDAHTATAADRARVRARALPARIGSCCSSGTVEPRKNLTRLAEAVVAARRSVPLVVAGRRRLGRRATPIGRTCGSSGSCPRPTCRRCTPRPTVFAYPSVREGFGLPVLEAMAQGTPVVTSRGTGDRGDRRRRRRAGRPARRRLDRGRASPRRR